MGYRGKVELQEKARRLRLDGRTLQDIADTLGVAKSSVSLWVRDIELNVERRPPSGRRSTHPQHFAKLAEIDECNRLGIERIGTLSDEAFLAAGTALYAGEDGKGSGAVNFANSDPAMITFFCAWLRHFFAIEESRLRMRVYLHEGLDLEATESFWSTLTGVPRAQFQAAYRAKSDPTRRHNKHEHGCAYVRYSCTRTHRGIMGLVAALITFTDCSGVAQSAERRPVKP